MHFWNYTDKQLKNNHKYLEIFYFLINKMNLIIEFELFSMHQCKLIKYIFIMRFFYTMLENIHFII